MKKIRMAVVLLVVAVIVCFFAYKQSAGNLSATSEMTCYNATFLNVFDTRTEIVGYAPDEEEFTAQVELLKEKLIYYNNLYDIYNDYEGINNIKTINDNAGVAPVIVDEQIVNLLKYSKDMYELTDGQVNIAMGSVLSIWHDYREHGIADPDNAKLPPMEELMNALVHTDISHVIINEEMSTVYLEDPEMSLDVGGIGKGYAVQKVADYAREIGMENVLISVGGNVCALGEKIDGSKWRLGIQNPDMSSETEYCQKVELKDKCVVTSGNYQRYYVVDGKRYCHIIDPDTLMPADYFASVSIITDDSGMADALSTAVYNMPLGEGLDFVNNMDGVEAMWILGDGSIRYSDHFEVYIGEEK